jgi:hypothetical protein
MYPKWPLSDLTKVPSWISRFGPYHFDLVFLVGFFYWTFFIVFFINEKYFDKNIYDIIFYYNII